MPTPCTRCQNRLNTSGVCENCKTAQKKLPSSYANSGATSGLESVTSTSGRFQVSLQNPRTASVRQQPQHVNDRQLQIQQQLQARSRLSPVQLRQIRVAAPRVLNRNSSRPRLNPVRCTNNSAIQVSQQIHHQLRQRLRVQHPRQSIAFPQESTRCRIVPLIDSSLRIGQSRGPKGANAARTDVFVEGSTTISPIRFTSASSTHISSPLTNAVQAKSNSNDGNTHSRTAVGQGSDHSEPAGFQSQQIVKVVKPIVSAVISPTTPPVSSTYEIAVSSAQSPPLYKILYPITSRPAIAGISSSQLRSLAANNTQVISSVLVTPAGTFQMIRQATGSPAHTQQANGNADKRIQSQSFRIMGSNTSQPGLRSRGYPSILNRLAIEPPPVVTIDDEEASSGFPEEECPVDCDQDAPEATDPNYYKVNVMREPDGTGDKGVFWVRAQRVRIGSFVLKNRLVTFSEESVEISARPIDSLSEEVTLKFVDRELAKTIFASHEDTLAALFSLSAECGPRIRRDLHMRDQETPRYRHHDDSEHPYFDPSSTLEQEKRIIIIFDESLTTEEIEKIKNCYDCPKGQVKPEFAERLLKLSMPNTMQDETPLAKQHGENTLVPFTGGANSSCAQDLPGTSSTSESEARNSNFDGDSFHDSIGNGDVFSVVTPSLTRGTQTLTRLSKDVVFTNEAAICQYPPSGKGCIVIRTPDFLTLLPDKSVNDSVIDFYLSYLIGEMLPKEQASKVFAFNTFFYGSLLKDPLKTVNPEGTRLPIARRRHANVKRWTKGVDLFTKDFILIPVCEHSHWFLIMICFPWLAPKRHNIDLDKVNAELEKQGQTEISRDSAPHTCTESCSPQNSGEKAAILIFDSLRGNVQAGKVYPMIRDYFAEEFLAKKKISCPFDYYAMRGYYPNAPQQTNSHDCGIFVLEFAKQFLLNPPSYFNLGTSNNYVKMFDPDFIMEKGRWEVAEVMFQLSEEQFPELRGIPRLKYEKLIKVTGKKITEETSTPPPPKRTRTLILK